MDAEALVRTLRAAFAGDLADGLRTLEAGLVALEGASGGERAERLREVFRAAHGLKGGARAAALGAVEAACHAMESLLGAARDRGRELSREDVAALLAAVDALKGVEEALRAEPPAPVDEAALADAQWRVEARIGGGAAEMPAVSPTATAAESFGFDGRSAAEPSRPRPWPPEGGQGSTPIASELVRAEPFDSGLAPPVRPERSDAESKGEAYAQDRRSDATASRSRRAPTSTAPIPEPTHRPSHRLTVRVPPERLDALRVTGAALELTA
ncbi:MAG TPA: Hpt domain-containing protein, partial [Anaeromyxobacteraceae bacterium]|nr:Hpt domain-containing protein [Anaeromyxobacteraceae bacterium]